MKQYFKILLLLLAVTVTTQSVYSQTKQLQLQNKKYEWQHRNINQGNKIGVVLKDNSIKSGMLIILNDSTIMVGRDTVLLKDIFNVKKDKIWKIALESAFLAYGGLFISIGTYALFVAPNGWGVIIAFITYVVGVPPAATGLIMTAFKSNYYNYKWNYTIGNKKVWVY